MKMFKRKKIESVNFYEDIFSWLREKILNLKFLVRLSVLVLSIFFVVWWYFLISWYISKYLKSFTVLAAKFVFSHVWEEVKPDDMGQINFLILGCWGEDWPWWWLTDTIMIASYNPKLKTVTFLSIPRDLYIENKEVGYKWKINWLFAAVYLRNKEKLGKQAAIDLAAKVLERQVKQITDVDIQKYVLVTFKWFVNFINILDWIDVNVPYTLIDTRYPTYDWWRTTIKFVKWHRHMNWRDALIYARSRHSTSDFSRAQRQQQIIKAVIHKLLSTDTLFDIDKIKKLYFQFKNMVYTDLTFKEILWLARYLDNIKHFFSFVYSADCDRSSWKLVQPGCLLYYPPRDLFNGISVLLPIWATPSNPSYYKNMKLFAFLVIYNQWFLLEHAPISIYNWIDRRLILRKYWWYKPLASDLAKKLKIYAFNVIDVKNAKKVYSGTVVYLADKDKYLNTLNVLPIFDLNFEVLTWSNTTGLNIILWNDYLK